MYIGQLIWYLNMDMCLLSNDREEMVSYDHVQIEKKKNHLFRSLIEFIKDTVNCVDSDN